MKIYKVRVEFETVIAAPNADCAAGDDDIMEALHDCVHRLNQTATEIKTKDDLPDHWDESCLPYGERFEDATIGDYLN